MRDRFQVPQVGFFQLWTIKPVELYGSLRSLASLFRYAWFRLYSLGNWIDPQIACRVLTIWFQTTLVVSGKFSLVTTPTNQKEIAPDKSG